MRYALFVPNFSEYGNTRDLCALARDAEAAGWDGFFLWDHILGEHPIVDSTLALSVIGWETTTIRIGLMVVPLPSRRPWKLAREALTLHEITGGRLVLGVGTGVPRDYIPFGENAGLKNRVAKFEEGLTVVRLLLSGQDVNHKGLYYEVSQVSLGVASVPLWVAGFWPRSGPILGASKADGFFPNVRAVSEKRYLRPTPDEVRAQRERFVADGGPMGADLIVMSLSTSGFAELAAYEEAGATWWLETPSDGHGGFMPYKEFIQSVRRGPPN
jgi:alkanesulfonate monooxygenase SsuD/methylene tetrahydromethanopterin reductase-like flavin-dependent oxidoreductase (luciferase family)